MVDGVIEAPYGAHFTSCAPDYGVDVPSMRAYADATSQEARHDYFQRFIEIDHVDYVASLGLSGPSQ
jgi:glutaconate CoA-transferase subunit A